MLSTIRHAKILRLPLALAGSGHRIRDYLLVSFRTTGRTFSSSSHLSGPLSIPIVPWLIDTPRPVLREQQQGHSDSNGFLSPSRVAYLLSVLPPHTSSSSSSSSSSAPAADGAAPVSTVPLTYVNSLKDMTVTKTSIASHCDDLLQLTLKHATDINKLYQSMYCTTTEAHWGMLKQAYIELSAMCDCQL